MKTAAQLLEASQSVLGARGVEYDQASGERSAAKIAAAWSAVTGKPMTEYEAWLFLVLLKAVRLTAAPGPHDDCAIDGAAYFALAGESKYRGAEYKAVGDPRPRPEHVKNVPLLTNHDPFWTVKEVLIGPWGRFTFAGKGGTRSLWCGDDGKMWRMENGMSHPVPVALDLHTPRECPPGYSPPKGWVAGYDCWIHVNVSTIAGPWGCVVAQDVIGTSWVSEYDNARWRLEPAMDYPVPVQEDGITPRTTTLPGYSPPAAWIPTENGWFRMNFFWHTQEKFPDSTTEQSDGTHQHKSNEQDAKSPGYCSSDQNNKPTAAQLLEESAHASTTEPQQQRNIYLFMVIELLSKLLNTDTTGTGIVKPAVTRVRKIAAQFALWCGLLKRDDTKLILPDGMDPYQDLYRDQTTKPQSPLQPDGTAC